MAAKPQLAVTDGEVEVLRLVATGHSNKEIDGQLHISIKTVEVHKANPMKELGLRGGSTSCAMPCCRAG